MEQFFPKWKCEFIL